MDLPDNPFWDFSLAAHRRPGVHEACLALQTDHDLDVNLLFYCLWAGALGCRLDRGLLDRALAAVDGWQEEVVRPVWRARWRLKPSFGGFPPARTEPLRRALVEIELTAEHLEQLQLAEAAPPNGDPELSAEVRAGLAAANLAAYLERFFTARGLDRPSAPELAEPLAALLAAAFPDLGRDCVRRLMSGNLP